MTEKYTPILTNTQIFILFILLFNRQILTWNITNASSSLGQVTGIGRIKCRRMHKEVMAGEKTVDATGCSVRSMKKKALQGNRPSVMILYWIVWRLLCPCLALCHSPYSFH